MGQETHSVITMMKINDEYGIFIQADKDRKEKNQHHLTPDISDKVFKHSKENSTGSRRSNHNSVTRASQHRSHGRRLLHRQRDEHHERTGRSERHQEEGEERRRRCTNKLPGTDDRDG
eukprot:11612860-Heterocapsa_arctica.AAC.1